MLKVCQYLTPDAVTMVFDISRIEDAFDLYRI